MATIAKTLQDVNGNMILPKTRSEQVYRPNGTNLEDSLGSLSGTGIYTLTHNKTNTTHNLTGSIGSDTICNISFIATTDYNIGDTLQINSIVYIPKNFNMTTSDITFKTGAIVSCILDTVNHNCFFKLAPEIGGDKVNGNVLSQDIYFHKTINAGDFVSVEKMIDASASTLGYKSFTKYFPPNEKSAPITSYHATYGFINNRYFVFSNNYIHDTVNLDISIAVFDIIDQVMVDKVYVNLQKHDTTFGAFNNSSYHYLILQYNTVDYNNTIHTDNYLPIYASLYKIDPNTGKISALIVDKLYANSLHTFINPQFSFGLDTPSNTFLLCTYGKKNGDFTNVVGISVTDTTISFGTETGIQCIDNSDYDSGYPYQLTYMGNNIHLALLNGLYTKMMVVISQNGTSVSVLSRSAFLQQSSGNVTYYLGNMFDRFRISNTQLELIYDENNSNIDNPETSYSHYGALFSLSGNYVTHKKVVLASGTHHSHYKLISNGVNTISNNKIFILRQSIYQNPTHDLLIYTINPSTGALSYVTDVTNFIKSTSDYIAGFISSGTFYHMPTSTNQMNVYALIYSYIPLKENQTTLVSNEYMGDYILIPVMFNASNNTFTWVNCKRGYANVLVPYSNNSPIVGVANSSGNANGGSTKKIYFTDYNSDKISYYTPLTENL